MSPINNDIQLQTGTVITAGNVCASLTWLAVADSIVEVQETIQISLQSSSVNVDATFDQFDIIIPANGEYYNISSICLCYSCKLF